MTISFPSREFDQAVADVCHGRMDETQAQALNQLLRHDPAARDEYLLRLSLHARLASDSDLFTHAVACTMGDGIHERGSYPDSGALRGKVRESSWRRRTGFAVVAAAVIALLATGWWRNGDVEPVEIPGATSMAVAMLDHAAQPAWAEMDSVPQIGSPLEPGQFNLRSGVVQVVFYSGARVVVEGPAEFELVSQSELSFRSGRLTVEVAPQAVGFRVRTPHASILDLAAVPAVAPISRGERSADAGGDTGTAFGMDAAPDATELHVFEGRVELVVADGGEIRNLESGAGVAVEDAYGLRPIFMDAWKFAPLFELQQRSVAAQTSRYRHWRESGERLNHDPSLLVRLDFEDRSGDDWTLHNACKHRTAVTGGTVVGCEWTSGRWPEKRALEFQSVNDRVRLSVPGEYESLTLAMWVRVQGLDRRINSLFMSDGFEPGTVHWSIRNDGVLGMTLIGPGRANYQIVATPPVLTLDRLGTWIHLAVVIDGRQQTVTHYLNGQQIDVQARRIKGPLVIGPGELGNWNAVGFPGNDPFLVRNFSGAMDEFCLFGRALGEREVRENFRRGKPQPDFVTQR